VLYRGHLQRDEPGRGHHLQTARTRDPVPRPGREHRGQDGPSLPVLQDAQQPLLARIHHRQVTTARRRAARHLGHDHSLGTPVRHGHLPQTRPGPKGSHQDHHRRARWRLGQQ